MVEQANLTFQKVYTLIAQTPIIHFQPDQAGAALRPSEVKPKLDLYLRKLCGDNVPETWLIPGQPKALNYQMRIFSQGSDKLGNLDIRDCKAYFGNMGDGAQKNIVFRDCRLEINCFVPDLLKFLDENIGSFFVLHNFGTRQSKGFGGYLVKGKTTEIQAEQILQKHYAHYFYAEFPQNTTTKGRLDHATVVYTCLKNGISMGNRGFPGYAINGYMYDDVGTDKEFISNCVMKNRPPAYGSYEFIRAVLGLAENYDYRQKGLVKVIHFQGAYTEKGKLRIPLESIENGAGIKRFQSPVLIKIFQNKMFFLLRDNLEDILGQVFILMREREWEPIQNMIKHKCYQDAQQALQRSARFISTPATFDGKFFMSNFVDYFDKYRDKIRRCPAFWKPTADLVLKKV